MPPEGLCTPECPALSHLSSAIGKKSPSSRTAEALALDAFLARKQAAGLGLGPLGLFPGACAQLPGPHS